MITRWCASTCGNGAGYLKRAAQPPGRGRVTQVAAKSTRPLLRTSCGLPHRRTVGRSCQGAKTTHPGFGPGRCTAHALALAAA
jgi:hypothetical protein